MTFGRVTADSMPLSNVVLQHLIQWNSTAHFDQIKQHRIAWHWNAVSSAQRDQIPVDVVNLCGSALLDVS